MHRFPASAVRRTSAPGAPALADDPATARRQMLRRAAAGFVLGAAWGVAARVWMRLITTDPGFSWLGTLFIVGLAAALGLGLGLLAGAQATGRRRRWWLAPLPGLLLLAGPGMAFIPAFALGGLAFSRRHGAGWRLLGVAAVGAGTAFLWWQTRFDTGTFLSTPQPMMARILVGFTLLSLALAAGSSVLYRSWAPSTRSATISPMGRAEVAAGEGALAT